MAVYHLDCRIKADPTKTNPPARVAKWQQACALASCDRMIWKGDMISCTRDNENGHRKGTVAPATIPAPPEEAPPATHRDPFPMIPPSSLERTMNEANAFAQCQRELEVTRRALDAARSELADSRNVIAAMRAVLAGAR